MLKKIAEDLNVPVEGLPAMKHSFNNYIMKASMPFLRVFIVIVGLFNLFLLVPDLFLNKDLSVDILIIVLRVLFVAAVTVLFFQIKKIKSFSLLSLIVSAVEIMAVAVFLLVLSKYQSPDFMIQLVGVIIIIIVVFLVPNRWMPMFGISVFIAAGFLLISRFTIRDLSQNSFLAGVVYLAITIALCGTFAYYTQKHQFGEFVAKEELKRASAMDHLTKLANRSKLMEEAGKWMDFCKRHGLPMSLIIIDIDNLKKINDTYGHLAGDEVIAALAGRMSRLLRHEDIMARWGGDEFVILLPNTNIKEAMALSERLRAAAAERCASEDIAVTCSFGITALRKDSTLESLIAKADKSLYRAKRLGKNCIQARE